MILSRGWRWGFGGGGGWIWCLILILLLPCSLSLTPPCPGGWGLLGWECSSQRVCVHTGNHLDNHRPAVWGHTQSLFEHLLPNSGCFEQGVYRVLPLLPQPFAAQGLLWPRKRIFCVKKARDGPWISILWHLFFCSWRALFLFSLAHFQAD